MTKQLAGAKDFAPVDERSRFAVQAGRRRWIKPTYMFACVVPPMLVLAWITAVVLVLRGQPFVPVAPPRPWLVAAGVAASVVGGVFAARGDTVERRIAWLGVVAVGTLLLVVAAVRP
jgi:formate hydrogenlyase subunit 3/multisubunit Na+/H+ antiporter MnhD subunit